MTFLNGKAYSILVGFFLLFTQLIHSQDQKTADSLILIYNENRLEGIEKMKLLRDISFNQVNNIEASLRFAEELIELAELEQNKKYLHSGYLRKGNAHNLMGDLEEALAAFIKSAETAAEIDYRAGQGSATVSIADVYIVMGNDRNAERYYNEAISILRTSSDSVALAGALLNSGDAYFNQEKFDKALSLFEESGAIYEALDYPIGKAYNNGNIGMVYAAQGNDDEAMTKMSEAIDIMEEMQDYYPVSVYLTYMSDIYFNKGNEKTAFESAHKSLDLSKEYGLKDQISDAHLTLSQLYEQTGDTESSLMHFRNHIIFRDSIKNLEAIEEMADLRTDFEVSQKQIEVDLLNEQKRNQRIITIATVIGLILVGFIAAGLYRRNRFIKKTNKIIAKERDRSDNLLLNILPEKTAEELKEHGKVKADSFESVSVLFTDFKGFTSVSEKLSPELLVQSVDRYFSKFDEIMEKHGLEKIKTIGDAYMCAGGLPFPSSDHAERMVLAARDIVDFVRESKEKGTNQAPFDIRVGINTGPVVAGVVGTKKFSYDIWGDTVNVASRMESNSEPGHINISESTYQLVKDKFNCSYRGEIEVKNRGRLKMYFVEGVL